MHKCGAVCGHAVATKLSGLSLESSSSKLMVSGCLVRQRHNHYYQVLVEIIHMTFWCCPLDHFCKRERLKLCLWYGVNGTFWFHLVLGKQGLVIHWAKLLNKLFLMQRFIVRIKCTVL